MGLSNDLLSQFAKVTAPKQAERKEENVYGTVHSVEDDGTVYVQLDGSEIYIPMSTTAAATTGERVVVGIKNHTAEITGNVTSPAGKDSEVKQALGNLVQVNSTLTQVNSSLSQINSVLQQEDGEFIQVSSKFEQYDSVLMQEDGSLIQVNSKFEQYDSDFSQINSVLKQEDGEFIQVNSKFEQIDSSLTSINADITVIDSQISTANSNISTLNANMSIVNSAFKIEDGVLTGLSSIIVEDINTKYASIDFLNVDVADVRNLYASSGLIKDLIMKDGEITGKLAAVEIDADNITTGSLTADRLRILGDDGLYYILNVNALGETTAKSDPKYKTGIDGSNIIAKSITAGKIVVGDLYAFDATIGGFIIDEDAIFTSGHTSIDSTTRGIYLGDDGQIFVGDSANHIKYYQDASDGNKWKLNIASDEITTQISNAVKSIDLGTRNYILDSDTEFNLTRTSSNVSEQYVPQGSSGSGRKFSTAIYSAMHDTFTISFDAKCSSGSSNLAIDTYFKGPAIGSNTIASEPREQIKPTATYKRYSTTVSIVSGRSMNENDVNGFAIRLVGGSGTAYIKNVKIESGNVATEWSKAPEDIVTQYAELDAKIDQSAQSITQTMTEKINGLWVGGRNLLAFSKMRSSSSWATNQGVKISGPDENGWFTVTGTYTGSSSGISTLWYGGGDASIAEPYPALLPAGKKTFNVETEGKPFISGSSTSDSTHIVCYYDIVSHSVRLGGYQPLKKTILGVFDGQELSVGRVAYYIGGNVNELTAEERTLNGKFRIKIEDGDFATAWTPAPEDVDFEFAQVQSQINQTPSMIELSVNKVKVGSRNLVLGTGGTSENGEFSFTTSTKDLVLTDFAKKLPAGSSENTLILSFYAKASKSLYLDAYWNDGSSSYNATTTTDAFHLSTDYQLFSCIIDNNPSLSTMKHFRLRQASSAHGSASAVGTVYIKQLKLSPGNKPTDWDLAPEEMASLKVTNDKIALTVQKDGVISAINLSSEKESGSAVKIQADKINLEGVTTFVHNNTTIGGTNLLPIKDSYRTTHAPVTSRGLTVSKPDSDGWFTVTGTTTAPSSSASNFTLWQNLNLPSNTRFYTIETQGTPFAVPSSGATWDTASYINFRGTAGEDSDRVGGYLANTKKVTKTLGVVEYRVAANTPAGLVVNGKFRIKVENGDFSTGWSPAPEDSMSIADYCSSGTTTIDGGKITTNSITADQIDVENVFAENLTATGIINFNNGKYKILSDANGKLEVKSVADISIIAGQGTQGGNAVLESHWGSAQIFGVNGTWISAEFPQDLYLSPYDKSDWFSLVGIQANTPDGEYSSSENTYWYYRKWSDGTIELWGKKGIPSGTKLTSWGGGWYASDAINMADYPGVARPTSIQSVHRWYVPNSGGHGATVWCEPPTLALTRNPGPVKLISPWAQTSMDGYLYAHVFGKWKEKNAWR